MSTLFDQARPMPGSGVRLTANAIGTAYSARSARSPFDHPFRPGLSGRGLVFRRGVVEGRVPTIGGQPIAPVDGRQPVLALAGGAVNALGESWACLEVRPDAKGELPKESAIEIVHRDNPRSLDKTLGRHPLCLILWRDQRPWQVHAATYFNLRYFRYLPPDGAGAVRHIFF